MARVEIPSGWTINIDEDTVGDDGIRGRDEDSVDVEVTSEGTFLLLEETTADTLLSGKTFSVNLITPNPSTIRSYEFTTMSKSGGGELTKLDKAPTDGTAQPSIRVGNVGSATGKVSIVPDKPVTGDSGVKFEITYTAAGLMVSDGDRSAGIRIQFPFNIDHNQISVKSGSATIVEKTTTDGNIDVSISRLTEGSSIVLETVQFNDIVAAELYLLGRAADGGVVGIEAPPDNLRASDFGANVHTTEDDTAIVFSSTDNRLTNLTVKDGEAPQITGGLFQPAAGSGTLAVSSTFLEKGETKSITLTYTATRKNPGRTIVFNLVGNDIQKATSTTGLPFTHAKGGSAITWSNLPSLDKGSKLVAAVTITAPDSTDDLQFSFTVDGRIVEGLGQDTSTADAAEVEQIKGAKITVVGKTEDVTLEIVDLDNGNPIDPSYPAASKQEIGIRFTATNTVIGENGSFSVTVPSLWSGVSLTGSTSVAKVQISETLTTEAIRDALPKNALRAGGRTITVRIDDGTVTNTLAKGASITVQYGVKVDDDKDYRATMPDVAGAGAMFTGKFVAHKNYATGHNLESVEATITSVADGSGIATISPSSVRAGSSNNTIEVRFEAEGSMGGGAVRLTIPPEWGEMQIDDAAANNLIAIRSPISGITLISDDLDDDDGDSIVTAMLPGDADDLNAFDDGDYLTFIYGGAPANMGAVAGDTIGLVNFTIESDGDDDGAFGKLTSTTAAPAAPANAGRKDLQRRRWLALRN